MSLLHRTFAVLLALFVASPFCCCSGALLASPAAETEAHYCCASPEATDSDGREELPCDSCLAVKARAVDSGKLSLPSLDGLFLTERSELSLEPTPSREVRRHPAPIPPDPGPPRLGLALRQSFLI